MLVHERKRPVDRRSPRARRQDEKRSAGDAEFSRQAEQRAGLGQDMAIGQDRLERKMAQIGRVVQFGVQSVMAGRPAERLSFARLLVQLVREIFKRCALNPVEIEDRDRRKAGNRELGIEALQRRDPRPSVGIQDMHSALRTASSPPASVAVTRRRRHIAPEDSCGKSVMDESSRSAISSGRFPRITGIELARSVGLTSPIAMCFACGRPFALRQSLKPPLLDAPQAGGCSPNALPAPATPPAT